MKIMTRHLNSYFKRMEPLLYIIGIYKNLITEIDKTISQINPAYMWELFVEKDMPYNLHTNVLCRRPQRYGLESLSFRRSLLWNTLKDEVKGAGTLTQFKKVS